MDDLNAQYAFSAPRVTVMAEDSLRAGLFADRRIDACWWPLFGPWKEVRWKQTRGLTADWNSSDDGNVR